MLLGEVPLASHGMNSIIGRFVSGLWQGQDQFVVTDAELIRAYGTVGSGPLLGDLGEGWAATRQDDRDETIFTRIISTRRALEQLGF